MNKNPLFSIIIPTKNPYKEFFLECIESIKNQTFKDYELIIVANGCDDEHLSFIKDNCKGSKIVIPDDIGLSRARNHGLDVAQSEYIVFVDDDDALNVDFLLSAKKALENNFDLVCFLETDDKNKVNHPLTNYKQYNKGETLSAFFNNANISKICETRSAWGKVYKKSIIDKYKLRYIHDLPAEDIVFCLEYASKVNNMAVYSEPCEYGYFYRYRPESISHRLDERMIDRFDLFNQEVARVLKENNMDLSFLYFHICNQSIYNIAISYVFHKDLEVNLFKRNSLLKTIFKRPFYIDAIKSVTIKSMFTKKKKLLLFLLKSRLYLFASILLNRRYAR